MANTKLQGSNIASAEWFTGRCPAHCELCFSNLGVVGNGCCYGIYLPEDAGLLQYDFATGKSTKRRLAEVGLPKVLDAAVRSETRETGHPFDPRNWEPLPGGEFGRGKAPFWFSGGKRSRHVVTFPRDARALYCIPKVPEKAWYHRQRTALVRRKKLPVILRVNTMSDSSTAPAPWIEQIRKVWGDEHCFFNCSVNALRKWPQHLEAGLFHKLVVTANPGRQTMPKPAEEGDLARGHGLYSLRGRKDDPGHFYTPMSLSDLGYSSLESTIKFYRVRTLPTITPRWDEDARVTVWTVVRFKSILLACEFARKYECSLEFRPRSPRDRNAKVVEFYRQKFGKRFSVVVDKAASQVELRLWSKDKLNASKHRGEQTVLHSEGAFWRAHKEQMAGLRWVCDRSGLACKGCGLCATLDAQSPDFHNPIMKAAGLPLLSYGEELQTGRANPDEDDIGAGDLWQFMIEDLSEANAPDMEERVTAALQEVWQYVGGGGLEDAERPMDQWNTHEQVEGIAARCYHWLIKHGKVPGDFCVAATGVDLFGLFEGFEGIADGTSDWCYQLD